LIHGLRRKADTTANYEEVTALNTFNGFHNEPTQRAHPIRMDEAPALYRLDDTSRPLLTIRAANSEGHRSSAHILVNRMYSGRGYMTSPSPDSPNGNRITLIASDHEETVGTITVGFDGPDGLLVDQSFADHVEQLRGEQKELCEFIKFAIDGVVRSRKVLASLMHAAFICAREVRGCDVVLIEVNPRHVRYYESMLGFKVLEYGRHNHRVNAPAVLMALDLAFAHEQIVEAHQSASLEKRSLYRHGFSEEEVTGVASRVAAAQERMVCAA
jgi:hypothetical protein